MEIAQEKTMKALGKFLMYASKEKSEIDCRIWNRKFLSNPMNEEATVSEVLKIELMAVQSLKKVVKNKEQYAAVACEKWIDVRSFGQVFAFKSGDDDSVSIGIRGPVSIHSAVSVSPVEISSMQITKSVNGETGKNPDKKSSDTMGMKHRVEFGLYVIYGSINHQLATKTGFSDDDAELIKQALKTLFENDCSSARPDGSMEVCKVYWWKHNNPTGQYSSAKVHRTLKIDPAVSEPKSFDDYAITIENLDGLEAEIYDGI